MSDNRYEDCKINIPEEPLYTAMQKVNTATERISEDINELDKKTGNSAKMWAIILG